MTWAFGDLRPLSYDLIVIDPMWDFENYSEKGEAKGPRAQYDCMPPEEIAKQFPVGQLAGGSCLLLCWATVPLIDRQIECIQKWGFVYRSFFAWHKVFASGKTAMGTGYRVRSMIEPVLVATIGEPKHKAFPGLFTGIRRCHSRKPETFYQLVDEKCPRLFRRADIFARTRRPGWEAFGNELDKFTEEST